MSRNCKASILFYPDSILYGNSGRVLKHSMKGRQDRTAVVSQQKLLAL